jgi:hypothetical protein
MLNFFTAYTLVESAAAVEDSNQFAALLLPMVVVFGFGAAITLGSIAWYNSKRPLGWEDKERPDIVPEIHESETPGLGIPKE